MKQHDRLGWLYRREITAGGEGSPYLTRWYLFPKWIPWSLYLHRFTGGDKRVYHDHPWWSLSFILRGGYIEHAPRAMPVTRKTNDISQEYKPGRFIFRKATHTHWVDLREGRTAWTLFLTGRRVREWGFHDPKKGWVKWSEYLGTDNQVKDASPSKVGVYFLHTFAIIIFSFLGLQLLF